MSIIKSYPYIVKDCPAPFRQTACPSRFLPFFQNYDLSIKGGRTGWFCRFSRMNCYPIQTPLELNL